MPETPPQRATSIHALHALSVYAEPLATGRRVVIVGDASLGLGERLATIGARIVHVYDPDAERARHAAAQGVRGVTIRELPPGDFDVREGAFDLAIVPDLAAVPDPAALVVRLRRLLGNHGAAILAARNAEAARGRDGETREARALDYYELFDLASLQFASVRMIGQMPFRGVAIVELGETSEDLAVSVDTQLAAAGEAPELFIALAGQRDVRLEPYAIIQLPPEERVAPPAPVVDTKAAARQADLERTRLALSEATLRAELLSSQLDEARGALTKLAAEEVRANVRDGEHASSLAEQATRLREVESRAGDNHVRAERLTQEIKKLEEELQRQRDRNFRLTRDVEDEKKARTKAEVELGMVRKSPELGIARERVTYLEEALRSADEVANALQSRLAELETLAAVRVEQLALLASEVESLREAAELAPAVQAAASKEIAAILGRAERAEQRAATVEREMVHAAPETNAAEVGDLEAALRERAHAIHALEHELVRRERMVHELLAALEELRELPANAAATEASASREEIEGLAREIAARDQALRVAAAASEQVARKNAELREKLDALALEAARREGDVQSTAWRIAELEQQLESANAVSPHSAEQPAARGGDADPRLADALEQIGVLQQALSQEHDALRRAEAGEELSRARAELQRQATLIEQLSRELEAHARPPAGVDERGVSG